MSTWVIVVAAGSGSRFGGAKQLEDLGGRRVLDWSLDAAWKQADGVVLVAAPDARTALDAEFAGTSPCPRLVNGGETRSGSVRAGLAAVPDDAEIVVVHDAARPLATPDLFERVIDAVRAGADAVVPGVAVVDTIRRRVGGVVDRDDLVAVQTPQAFRAAALRAAHAEGREATDDATLVEAHGGTVVVVPGEPENRKITTPVDLVIARALVGQRHGSVR